MKPKVMIIIATSILSGPGKGIFQFLRHVNKEKFDYVLCNFDVRNAGRNEFEYLARKHGLNLKLLKQRRRLDLSLISQAYKVFQEENCNIIQTHGYKGHVIGLVLSRLFGAKWIAFSHGWTNEDRRIRLYNKLDLWLLRFPKVVIAVSSKLCETIKAVRKHSSPTELVYNAIDEGELSGAGKAEEIRRRYKGENNAFLIGVFGRLSPEKGQRYIIATLDIVLSRGKQAVLLLVGDGPDRPHLERLAQELGRQESIKFLGYQTDMRDYYEAVDLMVLPSLSEGLPNVVLEAMITGRAVVATDVGGIRDIITPGKNGWIVPPGDAEALADNIVAVMEDSISLTHTEKIVRGSLYPKFAPRTRVKKIMQIYRQVLEADNIKRKSVC